jgi:hypothetical protein
LPTASFANMDEVHGHGNLQDVKAPPACCRGFICEEFALPFFGSEDHDGKTLDLERSFCSTRSRSWFTVSVKFVLWGLTVSDFVWGWIDSREPQFYLAYLSIWSMVYACVYETLSLLNTWCCESDCLRKATWVCFSIASVHSILVVLLFWVLEYDPSNYTLDYLTVMTHGGVCAILLIDGLVVNRVPVRLKHFSFVFLMALLYIIWNILQNTVVRVNPWDDDDDDALYDVLKWRTDTGNAILVAVIVLFVVAPLFHILIWGLSLCNRRYMPSEEQEREDPNEAGYTTKVEIQEIASP